MTAPDPLDGLREQVAAAMFHSHTGRDLAAANLEHHDDDGPYLADLWGGWADAALAALKPAVDALTTERDYYERLVTSANSLMAERVTEVAALTADFEQAVKRAIESQNRAIAAETEVAALTAERDKALELLPVPLVDALDAAIDRAEKAEAEVATLTAERDEAEAHAGAAVGKLGDQIARAQHAEAQVATLTAESAALREQNDAGLALADEWDAACEPDGSHSIAPVRQMSAWLRAALGGDE